MSRWAHEHPDWDQTDYDRFFDGIETEIAMRRELQKGQLKLVEDNEAGEVPQEESDDA